MKRLPVFLGNGGSCLSAIVLTISLIAFFVLPMNQDCLLCFSEVLATLGIQLVFVNFSRFL